MSRRKQARPSRHLDDEDGQPLGTQNEEATDGKSPNYSCRACRTDLGSAEALAVHRTLCVARNSDDSAAEDFDDEEESNNNTQNRVRSRRRRRKRENSANNSPPEGGDSLRSKRRSVEPDDSDAEDENEDELEEEEEDRMEESGKEMGLVPHFGSLPYLPKGGSGGNGGTPPSGSAANPGMNPLFPYAATLANANMTLDAMQNTKLAIAQFAANHASSAANSPNPAALQELAVLQSTLYALQQQHLLQLQLIQQLQQQLQISHPEGVDIAEQLRLMGFPSSLAKTTALIGPGDSSLSPSSHDSTPPPGSLRPPVKESKGRESDRSKDKTSVNLKANLPPQSELKIARVAKQEPQGSESPANPTKPSKSVSKSSGLIQVASFLNTPISSTGSSTTPSTAVTNSYNSNMILPGSSLADSILQETEPPPAPGGPSTLEMLQRTAQQVLNNASQGLLANNLADELGFRSNGTGGGSGDGKKDGLFKHRCRYCGKVFSSDSALQIHIRSHTGERPYKCNVCGNRFTTKGNLKVHFQRHAARFPHVKMNPNPVPEHLDKFHPPLLAQLDMDENDMSPPPPPLAPPPPPPNPVSVDPRLPHPGALFRANLGGSSGPNVPILPFYRTPNRDIFPPRLPMLLPPPPPANGGTESRDAQQTDPENLSSKSTGSNDKSGTNLNNSQSSDEMNQPNKRIKVEMLDKDEDMDSDSDHHHQREEAELQNESADLDRHDGSSLPSRGNSPVDEISKAPADDDAIDDRMSDREEDGDTPENLSASKPPSESPVLTAPSVSPAGHLQLSLPPCSTASGMLPFMSHHFSPHLPPHMRFPMGFPMHGPLPPYGPGSQRESSSGHGNGNHQLSLHNQGPFMFPADIDPSKDPAIYTNLLPRPGSNDNAWESLIEVTKTSETSKLQQLVDNIENKIVDPNQCVVCHRVLSCKSALQMHYRTHTGERPFKCKICGRAFTTKGNLKTHMGVHRAKPPARMLHMCPVCHKKFTNGLILQQHIRLHTGEPTDLTPEQIQAAEVREFHPGFPAMLAGAAGFHPFLPHGHFSHMGMRFPPHALESYKPLNLCPNSDDDMTRGNSATPRAERDGKDDFEASGGSSSEPLSPGSSINSCNLMLEQARALRYAAKAASGGGGQNQDAPGDHAEDNRSLTGKSEPDNSSDYQTHIKQEPDYEELSHRMRDFDNNDCEDPNLKNPRSQCSSVESKSPGLPPSVESRNSRSKAMLTPLDLTPRGQAVSSAASVTPPSLNSALSSLASSVYTTPSSFNPLNLPMNVPGRGNTTCNLCFKTFACHSALEIHYRSHTKERPFKCPVCDRGFSTKGNMKQHLMTHKHREGISDDKNSRESTDSKNSCFSPSKTEFLSIHEALKLSQNSKDRLTDEESPPKQNGNRPSWLNNVIPPTDHSSPSERDRPLDCRSSPEENRDKELTPNPSESKHLNSLTSLEHLANLAEHAMSGGHRTPIGLKVTADASWDDFHLRFDSNSGKSERPGSHPKRPSSGLPKHLCHVCHKNFSSSSALQIHTRTHTGDKPFVCTLCAKAFTTRGNLKVHMGTHVLNPGHSRRGRRMSLDFPTLALIRNNTMAHPPNTHPQDPILRLLPQLPKVPRSTIPLPEGILPMRSAFTRPPLQPELFFPYLLAQYPENLLPTQRTSSESEECNPMPSSDSHQREPPASDSPDSVSISSSPQGPRGRNHRDNGSTEDWLWRVHCPLSPTARPFAGAPSPPASHPGSLMERPIGAVRQGEDCSPPPTTTIVV